MSNTTLGANQPATDGQSNDFSQKPEHEKSFLKPDFSANKNIESCAILRTEYAPGLSFFVLTIERLTEEAALKNSEDVFSYPGHFVLNVQNGDKANTVELARFVSEAEAHLALDFVLWMQGGFEHFNEAPRQAVLSVMQYPGILAQNEFLATESKLEFEIDFFANALADFLKGKDVARPLSIGFKGLVSLLGDLYGYQEYVIWDDICPKGDAFQLMQLIGQSKALTQDDLVAIGSPIFSVNTLGNQQCALVFDDMHDGAFLFEQTWCKETFNLTLLHHTHSPDNAIDIAKRLAQQKVVH